MPRPMGVDYLGRRNCRKGPLLLGTAMLSILGNGPIAVAQDAINLETIVVDESAEKPIGPDRSIVASDSATGTKTATAVVDTSASISVVTQKEMETRGVENLQQAISYTSGVVVDEYGSDDRYDYFRIRGFDQTALGTYRDGLPARIPAWYTASRLEPYGLQRVEVLKGSTSTLFGLNGPGGLVNAITKRPQDEFHAEVFTTFGENHIGTGADFGGPIADSDIWSYRLTGLWQDAETNADYSHDDRFYIAPAFTIKPEEGTSLSILTDFSRRKSSLAYGIPEGVNLDPTTFLGEPDFNHFTTEQTDIGYQFEHEFDNGWTFRQNARYTHLDLDYETVYGASADPSLDRESFAVYSRADRFAIDNQLQYDTSWQGIESKSLFGVDYAYDDTHEDIRYGTADGIDIFNPVYCGRACVHPSPWIDWVVKQKALGVYAQEQLTFDNRWILTFGGRYDYVDSTADYLLTNTSDHTTAEAFTKRIGLTYKVTDGLALYANYSESFQPLVAPSANGYTVTGSLQPQEGQQYEVGIKYRPDSFDGLFTLALFDLNQTNVPTYVAPGIQEQIGEVEVRGVEFEAKFALNDQLNATLAYSYWDAEIVEDGTDPNEGNRPAQIPTHVASAWLDYTFPADGIRGDLTIGAGMRYVGQTYSDNANTSTVDAYTVVDAAINYKVTDHMSLAVNATNLFNREYKTSCWSGSCFYGDGRKVVGTLKYTW